MQTSPFIDIVIDIDIKVLIVIDIVIKVFILVFSLRSLIYCLLNSASLHLITVWIQ